MFNAFVVGNLTRDPQLKSGSDGKKFIVFDVAINFAHDEVFYLSCVAFKNTAKFIYDHFKKGSRIALTVSLRPNEYDTKDGGMHVKTVSATVISADFAEKSSKTSESDNAVVEPQFD